MTGSRSPRAVERQDLGLNSGSCHRVREKAGRTGGKGHDFTPSLCKGGRLKGTERAPLGDLLPGCRREVEVAGSPWTPKKTWGHAH